MTTAEVACVVSISTLAIGLVAYHVSVMRELWVARRETSRFPLFAARARLVALIADGRMQESDQAWRDIYGQVNFLLGMDQRLHMVDFVTRYVKSRVEQEKNPKLRARIEQSKRKVALAAKRVPDFGAAVVDVNDAILYMVRCRTHVWHRAVMVLVVLLLRIASVALSAGVGTASVVLRAFRRPSADDFRSWHEIDRTFC